MAAYEGARSDGKVAAINKTKAGSVDATVIAYLHSDGFANGLAKSTRGTRRRILTNFAKEHGDKPVAMMYAQALTNIIKKMTPANQRGFKKAMRGFIDYCLSHNLMKIDPLPSIKLDKMKDKGGFQPGKKTRSPHTKPDTREAPKPDWPWNCYCRPEPLDATW